MLRGIPLLKCPLQAFLKVLSPEVEVMYSGAGDKCYRHLVFFEECVELTIGLDKEVLGTAGHIYVRELLLFFDELLYQVLRIIFLCLEILGISEGPSVVIIVCHRIIHLG